MCKTHTDSRIFLIADTHFGDENIRLYEERPFPETDTMDLEMIRRWNSVVSDHDLVYHLGDFCSGGPDRCRELLSQLKGRKFLVMGNHDSYLSPQQWRDLGFEECYDLPVILKDFFILSHTPLYITRSMPYANLLCKSLRSCTQQSYRPVRQQPQCLCQCGAHLLHADPS